MSLGFYGKGLLSADSEALGQLRRALQRSLNQNGGALRPDARVVDYAIKLDLAVVLLLLRQLIW